MALEDLVGADKFIDDLVDTNPVEGDDVAEGNEHIQGIKNVLGNSFPAITGAVTSTHTELNILDGATVTTAELNILDGVTATAAELNILDGVTATTAELNYVDGVTSNIQDQLDASRISVFTDKTNGDPTIGVGLSFGLLVSQTTWTSIGPTGSGASQTWADLDSIPTDADWIEVAAYWNIAYATGHTGSYKIVVAGFRENGTSGAGATTYGDYLSVPVVSGTAGLFRMSPTFKLPINASNVFDLYWQTTLLGTLTGTSLFLRGWGKNSS
jgi:hypothetical protein